MSQTIGMSVFLILSIMKVILESFLDSPISEIKVQENLSRVMLLRDERANDGTIFTEGVGIDGSQTRTVVLFSVSSRCGSSCRHKYRARG